MQPGKKKGQTGMSAKIIPFDKKEPVCSFCNTPKSKAKAMAGVAETNTYICDKCLAKCTELSKEE